MCMQQWTPAAPMATLRADADPAAADAIPRQHGRADRPGQRRGRWASRATAAATIPARRPPSSPACTRRRPKAPTSRTRVSMDQIVAGEFGKQTQLASLELGLEMNEIAGTGEDGYSAAYSGALAWRGPHDPLPVEADPRAVFERLFGASESTDRATMAARMKQEPQHPRLGHGGAGIAQPRPRRPRSLEGERVSRIGARPRAPHPARRRAERPRAAAGRAARLACPTPYEEHAYLMFDLMALAYQTDLTRVVTFLMGREKSGRAYPEAGVPDSHHSVSHHQNRPEIMEKVAKINTFHMKLFAHFLERMKATQRRRRHAARQLGDSSTAPAWPTATRHFHHNVPMLLMGGGGRPDQGRPSHRGAEGHAAHQPAPHAARQAGRAGGASWATAPASWNSSRRSSPGSMLRCFDPVWRRHKRCA